MNTSFHIGEAHQNGGFNLILGKNKVEEDDFWNQVETAVNAITAKRPEKREETLELAKWHLMRGKKSNITIGDKYFERATK